MQINFLRWIRAHFPCLISSYHPWASTMLGLELGKRVALPSAAPAQATQDQTWIAGEIWLILDDSFGGRKHRSWALIILHFWRKKITITVINRLNPDQRPATKASEWVEPGQKSDTHVIHHHCRDSVYGGKCGKQIREILSCEGIEGRNPSNSLSNLLIFFHDPSASE
jgi:hypothetical protein